MGVSSVIISLKSIYPAALDEEESLFIAGELLNELFSQGNICKLNLLFPCSS
jgi:hypothetical protein